jgi:tetratricopeptide (TPR) repeat protein
VLATLLEEADLLSELLALRRRELTLGVSIAERIALRLDMSRLAGLMEERSARVSTLLANLQDAPGDEGTLAALDTLLVAKGQYKELADILTTEARSLDDLQLAAKAAPLWGRVAILAEQHLADPTRASTAYEKMVAVTPSAHAFDALARLALQRGEPRAAAAWLEQRLAGANGVDRVEVSLRLAQCYADSGQRHRAIGASREHSLNFRRHMRFASD